MRSLGVLVGALVAISPAAAATFRTGQPVMGTVLQATVVAEDAPKARRLALDAIDMARHWDDVLTTWRPEGELRRLNERAGQGAVATSADLGRALAEMKRLSVETDGAFDPAVGPLVDLWRRPVAPDLSRIGPWRLAEALRLDGGRAELAAGSALDAGGIGKGIALDAMARHLRGGGATAAWLDFGGSSQLAFGEPPESAQGWRIVVAGVGEGTMHGTLRLRDAALSTSRALGAGAAEGPIIDPRSGRPVDGPRVVTVVGPDATSTEAWSTALVVLGRSGLERLRGTGLEALLEDSEGVTTTPGFPLEEGQLP